MAEHKYIQRLHKVRMGLALSMKDFARLVGISQGTYRAMHMKNWCIKFSTERKLKAFLNKYELLDNSEKGIQA